MSEKQLTIPAFGLDRVVPTRRHATDLVECSDGAILCHSDVCYDVKGGAHSNEADRDEAEVAIVQDILKSHEEWVDDYTSGANDCQDYGEGYAYIASECSDLWPDRIREWLDDNGYDYGDRTDAIVDAMCDEIDDWDAEYSPNEYACYSGSGICLYSLEVGEYEDQVDLSGHDELAELHELGRLEGILGELDREFCLYRSSRWNRETEQREYGDYVSGGSYPNITVTFNPGGQWYYVVSEESAKAALCAAIVKVCRESDS